MSGHKLAGRSTAGGRARAHRIPPSAAHFCRRVLNDSLESLRAPLHQVVGIGAPHTLGNLFSCFAVCLSLHLYMPCGFPLVPPPTICLPKARTAALVHTHPQRMLPCPSEPWPPHQGSRDSCSNLKFPIDHLLYCRFPCQGMLQLSKVVNVRLDGLCKQTRVIVTYSSCFMNKYVDVNADFLFYSGSAMRSTTILRKNQVP